MAKRAPVERPSADARVSAELEEMRHLHREMIIMHRETTLMLGERLLNVEARERALASVTIDDAAAGHA